MLFVVWDTGTVPFASEEESHIVASKGLLVNF